MMFLHGLDLLRPLLASIVLHLIDGLLVGSLFSFVWNALISMSFQIPGFLLTYLLHTTHAAKHGSRAGLGITLVQYGFQMRFTAAVSGPADPGPPPSPDSPTNGA